MTSSDRKRIRRVLGVEPGSRYRVMPAGTWEWLKNAYPIRRPLNLDREGICDLCGRKELVFPVTGSITLCRRHMEAVPTIEQLKALGRVVPATNFSGQLKCDICGRSEPVMYIVYPRKLCLRCMWYVLGKKNRRLSIAGTRIV